MEQKPLIGISICAVVILIITSFSNVVGYQSVKSTAVNDSPLFQTRTQRATNQEQNVLTSQYLGMGKENLLQFPKRENIIDSLNEAIGYISQMDEQKFARFTQLCIERIHHEPAFDNIDEEDITQLLQLLRDGPTRFNRYAQNHTYNMYSVDICRLTYDCFPSLHWFPGCLLMGIKAMIVYFILNFFIICLFPIMFIMFIISLIPSIIRSILTISQCV
jgi:hypothetical protein